MKSEPNQTCVRVFLEKYLGTLKAEKVAFLHSYYICRKLAGGPFKITQSQSPGFPPGECLQAAVSSVLSLYLIKLLRFTRSWNMIGQILWAAIIWEEFESVALMKWTRSFKLSCQFSHLCFRATGIGPPCLCWQRRHACRPHQSGGIQKKGLRCHCTCPLEHLALPPE